MKRILVAYLTLALSSGCMSAAIKTPAEGVRGIRKIAVVPMEAPPLEVAPFALSGTFDNASSYLVLAPDRVMLAGGKVGVMVFGIFMLMELPTAIREAAKVAESLDSMLGSEDAWIPTTVLAQEATRRIASEGSHDAILERAFLKYPGITNRERTVFLENWMAPIRDWYGQDVSPFDYRAYKDRGVDAVLEVGLSNYSLYQDHMILQVLLKLVDPGTGRVLGRARQTDLARINRPESLFEGNGRPFKDLFTEMGGKLVAADLADIGLLPMAR
jgi:hypothetical protein